MMKAVGPNCQEDINLVEVTAMNISIVDNISEEVESIDSFSHQRWRDIQRNDSDILKVIQALSGPVIISSQASKTVKLLITETNSL